MARVIVVMGVSGCGKTSIGKQLASALEVPFFDADDFHPEENIKKMKNGQALNDTDRKPWLVKLSENISTWQNSTGAVLACSALRESYRTLLTAKENAIFWVVLQGDYNLIKQRMERRNNHYMKPEMLQSQFDALEVPKYGFHISIEKSIKEITKSVIKEVLSHD